MHPDSTPHWPLSRIQIGEHRHRRDFGDINGLARNIAEVGLLHPLVVKPDGMLIAGERRLRAVQLLGWETVPVHVAAIADIVRGELAENTQRDPFTPSEMVAIMRTLQPAIQEAARDRQVEHGGTAPGRAAIPAENTGGNLPPVFSAPAVPATA